MELSQAPPPAGTALLPPRITTPSVINGKRLQSHDYNSVQSTMSASLIVPSASINDRQSLERGHSAMKIVDCLSMRYLNTLTPNKPLLSSQLQKQARSSSTTKVLPIHLVHAAAARAKINSEQKQEKISKLELQKQTLKHLHLQTALEPVALDFYPKSREEKERVQARNSSSNIIVSYGGQNIEEHRSTQNKLQPTKYAIPIWAYKNNSEAQLRREYQQDSLNGKYCNRLLASKQDLQNYQPTKIFKSMYQKQFEQKTSSRNDPHIFARAATFQNVQKSDNEQRDSASILLNTKKGRELIEAMRKSKKLERDNSLYPKNDYMPEFTTSLNFNFNTQDIFGPRFKGSAGNNLLKGKEDLREMAIKTMDGRRRGSIIKAREALYSQIGYATGGSRGINKSHVSTTTLDEDFQIRRQLNREFIKNEYTVWAGMYVKKRNSGGCPATLDFQGSRNSHGSTLPGGLPDQHGLTSSFGYQPPSQSNEYFGLNFSKKKHPFLPEQEDKRGYGIKLLPPPQKKLKAGGGHIRMIRKGQQKQEQQVKKMQNI